MSYWIYILRCGDDSLYTGTTDNVQRRLDTHKSGKGAKYTRGRGPLTLVYTQEVENRSAALIREAAIKKYSRSQKLQLIGKSEEIV